MVRREHPDVTLPDTDLNLTTLTLTSGAWDLIANWLRHELPITQDHLVNFISNLFMSTADLATTLHQQTPTSSHST